MFDKKGKELIFLIKRMKKINEENENLCWAITRMEHELQNTLLPTIKYNDKWENINIGKIFKKNKIKKRDIDKIKKFIKKSEAEKQRLEKQLNRMNLLYNEIEKQEEKF